MLTTVLKDKGQITLPAEVRRALSASRGDIFEVRLVNGMIVMSPQKLVPAENAQPSEEPKKVNVAKYLGIAKGIYGNAEEIDDYIRKERDSWT